MSGDDRRTEVVPAGEAGTTAVPDAPGDAARDDVPPRPPGSRPPRDRAVRREDAEQLELDDPPDAPPLSGDGRRARDRG
jgi:hypothetical protein